MARRMVLMLVAMTAFLAFIGFVKFRQIQEASAQGSSNQPPPEAVTTVVAQEDQWEQTLGAIGTVVAINGVVVSADLPGVVDAIHFDSGRSVKSGDLLVELDTRQERAQLASAVAGRDLARMNLDRAKGLKAEGVISQADMDQAQAAYDQGEGTVGETSATIDRKTIRAPFTGLLGIRQVNLGQYLTSGSPIVPLQSLDPIFVDFNLPQQEMTRIQVGSGVRVASEGLAGEGITGKVTAIDSVVDTSTRNVQVRARFDNHDLKLRPGMFVRADVILPAPLPVIALPASSIRYAPYGDSVFVVEKMKGPKGDEYLGVRQQVVKLGTARGDQIAVLSGVKSGEQIVTSGVFKLRNGAAVLVNNAVQPGNDPAPKPEDS